MLFKCFFKFEDTSDIMMNTPLLADVSVTCPLTVQHVCTSSCHWFPRLVVRSCPRLTGQSHVTDNALSWRPPRPFEGRSTFDRDMDHTSASAGEKSPHREKENEGKTMATPTCWTPGQRTDLLNVSATGNKRHTGQAVKLQNSPQVIACGHQIPSKKHQKMLMMWILTVLSKVFHLVSITLQLIEISIPIRITIKNVQVSHRSLHQDQHLPMVKTMMTTLMMMMMMVVTMTMMMMIMMVMTMMMMMMMMITRVKSWINHPFWKLYIYNIHV